MEQNGIVLKGTILGYDQENMTATIASENPVGIIYNVVCLFDRCDYKNAAYSFRAPSEGADCIYTTINGTTYLLGIFPPVNLTDETCNSFKSDYGNTRSRKPKTMLQHKVKPGNTIDTNSMGSEDTFTDTMKKIIMAPNKLSSIWNIMNSIWENICLIFRLYSGPMDVTCEVDEKEKCNTTVKVRREICERKEDATTTIDLRMGNDADIIQLNINGAPLLHVDQDRNVIIIAKKIDLTATQINYNADEFNCLNVQTVKLP